MKDREKLKKLVLIFDELLKLKGNEWLVDELIKIIGKSASIEDIAQHSVIRNIHEYCIEQNIQLQAIDFYRSFEVVGIKEQLIDDYKKMEHERRRDDFYGFCLCIFQQVEAIVNFLFESSYLKNKIKAERNSPAFMEWDSEKVAFTRKSSQRLIPYLLMKINPERNKNSPKFNPDSEAPFYEMDEKSIEFYFDKEGTPIIDYNPSKKSWGFVNRFRAVLFYFYFNGEIKKNDMDSIYRIGHELYIMRNQNHRESKPTESQKEIIESIIGNEGKYYLKFYGFLSDFTSKIELSLSQLNNSSESNRPIQMPLIKNLDL